MAVSGRKTKIERKWRGIIPEKTREPARLAHADYVLVTDGLPIDVPEKVMPFDDTHLDKKK